MRNHGEEDKYQDIRGVTRKCGQNQNKNRNKWFVNQTKGCNAIHPGGERGCESGYLKNLWFFEFLFQLLMVKLVALRADERRDKLRKASGRSKYPLIRRCLNGETRLERLQSSIRQSITDRREPAELKHLSRRRRRKKHRFPK